MNHGGDVLGVLGWGLRRYAPLIVLCVATLGLAVPAVLNNVPERYEAQAQVGPSQALTLPKLDALPRLGESIFNNGAVAESVRAAFDPPLPAADPVIPRRVDLVAAQDNIVFTVVGRGSTPDSAQRIANVAAATFSQEINNYSQTVGSFAVQRLASRPIEPVDKAGGVMNIVFGLLAGLVAGVGLIALILVWRRPVLDVADAEDATSVPVFGRVLLATHKDFTRGLPQLCRRVMAGSTDTLLLAGPHNTRRERRLLASVLADVVGWNRDVLSPARDAKTNRSSLFASDLNRSGKGNVVIIDEPSQEEIATRPDTSVTLLIVREGIGRSKLRRQAEEYLDGGAEGVVLVRRPRHVWRPRKPSSSHLLRKTQTAAPEPEWGAPAKRMPTSSAS